MADKIGVLGEAATLTVGTHTVYTVPSGKAAKIKLMWRALMANTGTILITVNGIVIFGPVTAGGAEYFYSSGAAIYEEMGTPTNPPDGVNQASTVGPAPEEYYLSAGDTVSYTLGVVDVTAISVQVVGAEIDVT